MVPDDGAAKLQQFVKALQDTTLRCERLMEILSILRQMDELNEPSLSLDEICRRILEPIAFELAAENCSLYLMDEQGERLELRAACSPFEERGKAYPAGGWTGSRFKVGEGIVGTVAKTRKPLRVSDAATEGAFLPIRNGRVQVRSLIAFPLLMRDKVIGVLNLSHSEPGFFTATNENALSFIAQRAAQILAWHTLWQRLRESEKHYRLATQNAGDAFFVFDKEGNIIHANPVVETISGIPPDRFIRGEALWEDRIVPEDRPRFVSGQDRLIRTGKSLTIKYRYLDAQDRLHYLEQRSSPFLDGSGNISGVVSVVRDVTDRVKAEEERRALEAQVQHVQKLESLGILAGGIAHDFNNLLVGIIGNAGLAIGKLPPDSPVLAYLEKVESAARRAAELTRELLAYSGKGTFVIGPVHLSNLARDIGHLLEAIIGKGVVLEYDCAEDVPFINGDAAQLQQVLMNLITNASDAIGDNEGRILLRIRSSHFDREYLSRTYIDEDLAEGEYVCLDVSDTGCGMNEKTLARMFDPFFTTKFAGRGLGLAAVLGIVRSHRGAIQVHSEPGRGTTVTVLFPALKSDDPAFASRPPTTAPESEDSWHGSGAVLVADDEPNIREVAQAALGDIGFEVLTAADGREAVELFRANAARIRAVLLDLTMPVMGGKEAFEEIHEIRPDVPVILSSGYAESEAVSRFEDKAPKAFIQKPFWPTELIGKFREVLEDPSRK